jgi:ADP-ribose pyrophosphatase YjhB (NUDIX family)
MADIDKVYAYITHGDDLLVFEQPDAAAAGVQVPGGSVEARETLIDAVMREAREESGLEELRCVRFLGSRVFAPTPGMIHRRHFFHLESPNRVAETWDHLEEHPSSGGAPIAFRLRWVSRVTRPRLAAELDVLLDQLDLGLERAPAASPARVGRIRHAARVLLLDTADRLLLLSARGGADNMFWVTPGGGLGEGETYCDAIRRELREEVGVEVELGPLVWFRRHVFQIDDRTLDQRERFFVGRARTTTLKPFKQDDYVFGHRWWSYTELAESSECFAPRTLRQHLANVLDGNFPQVPFDVGI